MFLKNVTMTHHVWRFPYFHHRFEVLGSRPKNQWHFINFVTIRPTTKWRFNKFVTINKLKITIVFLTYQVYGAKFLYTEIFYKIEIAKKNRTSNLQNKMHLQLATYCIVILFRYSVYLSWLLFCCCYGQIHSPRWLLTIQTTNVDY